jgi:voltage-gated potassium channel
MTTHAAPELPRGFRHRLHTIIFESDTRAGRAFDVALLWAVLLSVLAVTLESVAGIRARHERLLHTVEWAFTLLFTIEYVLRVIAIRRPRSYVLSFFGLIDLLSFLPTYLSLLVPGSQAFAVIRIFRVVRMFRIFKLAAHLHQARVIGAALRASRPKIIVFLLVMAAIVTTMGAVMYLVEGEEHGFTSIPKSMYWAVITLTTVGYGDLVPSTPVGQAIASIVMIMGYAIIAVPTGIVTAELASASRVRPTSNQACPACGIEGHDADAVFCKRCAARL